MQGARSSELIPDRQKIPEKKKPVKGLSDGD